MEHTLKLTSLLMVFFLFLCLPLVSQATKHDGSDGGKVQNPASELWRNVRQREFPLAGTSQVKAADANVLINVSGESWRQYRINELIPKASIALFVGLIGVFLFRLLRGNIKLADGRSGIKILRFTLNQRVAHWCTAILFVTLALTGIILLLGRKLLIPMIGSDGFGYIAVAAKLLHDYLGPAFAVSLLLLFVLFVRDNFLSPKIDMQWLAKGGGMIGKHASADRYNFGEKGWFWIAVLVGGAIVVSGLVLDFPIFGQTRATMEFYLLIHGIAALIMIIASFGHIYMGTAALEGTFEVMQTGYCDSNWAKEHHDLWYEKVKDSAGESSHQAETGSEDDGMQEKSIDTAR
jgi:formate dehydrogenase subunit gamma